MHRRRVVIGLLSLSLGALLAGGATVVATTSLQPPEVSMPKLVPQPVSVRIHDHDPFELTGDSRILATGDGAAAVGEKLAETFRTSTGFALPVIEGADAAA